MDATYVAAFVKSTRDVVSTMLNLTIKVGTPQLLRDVAASHDVSAIIGLTGDITGSVALCFPTRTASEMVGRFIGCDVEADSADFADGVGELANMVTGGAKASFSNDRHISISCPSVIIGPGHRVFQQKDMPVIQIPFDSPCGVFEILVSIRCKEKVSMRSAS